MEWYQPWTWGFDDSTLAGMLGGLILGLCRMLMSLSVVSGNQQPNKKYLRLLIGHTGATVLFTVIGAAVAWAFQGKAGDFLTGMTALITIIVLGGKLMPANSEALMNTPVSRNE